MPFGTLGWRGSENPKLLTSENMCAEFFNLLPFLLVAVDFRHHTQKERIGSLELGKEADFVILSCKANAEAMLKVGRCWCFFGDLELVEAFSPTQGGNMDPSGSCLTAIVLYLIEGTSVKVKIFLEQKIGLPNR